MMTNIFYFTLKALFVLKIFKFLSSTFGHVEKRLDSLISKTYLISKFMAAQHGNQTIAIHTLPYISRIKSNQTVKCGQLIEYDMRNIFLEKSNAKCGGETIPRSFPKNLNLNASLYQQPKFLNCLFSLHAKLRVIKTY